MYFATTTANTGHSARARIILGQLLRKQLLHFTCCHHILEIIPGSVFQERLDSARAPKIDLIKLSRHNGIIYVKKNLRTFCRII